MSGGSRKKHQQQSKQSCVGKHGHETDYVAECPSAAIERSTPGGEIGIQEFNCKRGSDRP